MCRCWSVLPTFLLLLPDDDSPDTNQYSDNKSYHSSDDNIDELYHAGLMTVACLILKCINIIWLHEENLIRWSQIINLIPKIKPHHQQSHSPYIPEFAMYNAWHIPHY
jgi:hypothetical protein